MHGKTTGQARPDRTRFVGFIPLSSSVGDGLAAAGLLQPRRRLPTHYLVRRFENRLPVPGCGDTGLDEWSTRDASALLPRVSRDNEMAKRLMWSGLMAAVGAVATIAANRVATVVWRRLFNEDPPE
jgi:hypothetical protein